MDGPSKITITITMAPLRAVRLMHAMRRLAEMASTTEDARFWRTAANMVGDQCKGVVLTDRSEIIRPKDDDEVALKRVLNAEGPDLPVLSRMDARRVVARLGHRYSARNLAHRLYMSPRSVSRWRAEFNRGAWKKYDL